VWKVKVAALRKKKGGGDVGHKKRSNEDNTVKNRERYRVHQNFPKNLNKGRKRETAGVLVLGPENLPGLN